MSKKRSSTLIQKQGYGSVSQSLDSRETGGWKKKWKNRLPVGLIYPNTYAVGMSNLGFQLVYGILNRLDNIVCERIFLPHNHLPPDSIESGRCLSDFPLLLCSVSFEQDFINLITLLDQGNIPPLASDRYLSAPRGQARIGPVAAGHMPLLIAGGVATFINPEPLAPFVDLFIIGEAETILEAIMGFFLEHCEDGVAAINKDSLLEKVAEGFPHCYVPKFYSFQYSNNGILSSISPRRDGIPPRITKAVLSQSQTVVGHSQILTPEAEFSDLFMTELGRGCSRGCRFCAAGFVYRPPRLWPADRIIAGFRQRPATSNRIGLLGMEMARSKDLNVIAEYLLKEGCSLSFSSLRADVISPVMLELLEQSRLKTSAIAPDGASQRLRQVINKGITEEDLLTAAESLVRAGVLHLKLYFMIGLPTETMDDLDEMVGLIMKIKEKILEVGRARKRLCSLTLSLNCFIPKPWTPFQFHPFEQLHVLKERIAFLRKRLQGLANIKFMVDRPEKTLLQAVLARGDRRLAEGLLRISRTGKNWRQVMAGLKINIDDYAIRQRSRDEVFPWEVLDLGIERQFLWEEYRKGLAGKKTAPCVTSKCNRCGVCNGS